MFELVLVDLSSAVVMCDFGETVTWRNIHDFRGNFSENFPTKTRVIGAMCVHVQQETFGDWSYIVQLCVKTYEDLDTKIDTLCVHVTIGKDLFTASWGLYLYMSSMYPGRSFLLVRPGSSISLVGLRGCFCFVFWGFLNYIEIKE